MRTTINLDDDVLPAVKQYAERRSVSVGKALSELVRKGINASLATRVVNGLHVVELPSDSPRVTTHHVRQLDEDE
jgi:Arc/MetJ family transcription regulator